MLRKMDFKNKAEGSAIEEFLLIMAGFIYKNWKTKDIKQFGIELLNILENNTYEELREILRLERY